MSYILKRLDQKTQNTVLDWVASTIGGDTMASRLDSECLPRHLSTVRNHLLRQLTQSEIEHKITVGDIKRPENPYFGEGRTQKTLETAN